MPDTTPPPAPAMPSWCTSAGPLTPDGPDFWYRIARAEVETPAFPISFDVGQDETGTLRDMSLSLDGLNGMELTDDDLVPAAEALEALAAIIRKVHKEGVRRA